MSSTDVDSVRVKEDQSQEVLFSLRHISKTFEGDTPVLAIDELTIPRGAKVAILGHSGSGKTTLVRILGLLETPDSKPNARLEFSNGSSATTLVNGKNGCSENTAAQIRASNFGFVFQDSLLLGHLSARLNATLGLRLAGWLNAGKVLQPQMESLGITDKVASERSSVLSGGEKQRVAFLRAIGHRPAVLFADEPTGSLDQATSEKVIEQLRVWHAEKEGRSLVLVTHDAHLAFVLCDYFIILQNGKLLENRIWSREEFDTMADLALHTRRETGGAELSEPVKSTLVTQAASSQTPKRPLWAVRLTIELALRDLLRREHLLITMTSVAILTLMFALCMIGWGLLEGKRQVMADSLDSPLAKRLDLSTHEDTIQPSMLDRLGGLKKENGEKLFEKPKEQLKLWDSVQCLFARKTTSEMSLFEVGRGKAISIDDPFLKDIVLVDGSTFPGFSSDEAAEVLVTNAFLKRCGYTSDADTLTVHIGVEDSGQGEVAELKVVGVCETLLDRREQAFALPAVFHRAVVQKWKQNTENWVREARLEPIPGSQAQACVEKLIAAELDPAVTFEVSEQGVRLKTTNADGLPRWRIVRAAEWGRDDLVEAGLVEADTVRIIAPNSEELLQQQGFLIVSAYVDTPHDLPLLAAKAPELGLYVVDPHYVVLTNRMVNTIGPLSKILGIFVVAAGVLAFLATGINIYQRVDYRRTEIGVLRAIGMKTQQFALMYGFEGAVLGLVSSLAGSVIAWSLGGFLGEAIQAEGANAMFVVPFWAILVGIASMVFLSIGACLLATWRCLRAAPAALISKQ